MQRKPTITPLAVFIGIWGVVLFSTKAVLVKLAYQYEINSLELLLFRMLFALPVYVTILVILSKKKKGPKPGKDFLWIFLFGFLGYYLASYFDFLGLNYIKAGLERIILFIYSTIVVLLSYLFFREKLSRKQTLAIVITYVGVVVTFWNELGLSGPQTLWGGFLVFLSAVTYASYIVGSGWLIPKYGVLRFTCYAMLVSTACVIVHYSLVEDWKLFDFPPIVYGYGIAMALIATFIPSFLVSEAIKRMGASNFSILGSLGPVSTIILAYFFLDETMTLTQLLGMLIVIGGVTFLAIRKKPKAG